MKVHLPNFLFTNLHLCSFDISTSFSVCKSVSCFNVLIIHMHIDKCTYIHCVRKRCVVILIKKGGLRINKINIAFVHVLFTYELQTLFSC